MARGGQSQPAARDVPLEPGQLSLQRHQAAGQDRLRAARSPGQELGLEDQQIADEQVVLLEPGGERAGRKAALPDTVEKRVAGGGPPFVGMLLEKLGGGHRTIVPGRRFSDWRPAPPANRPTTTIGLTEALV